jgi:hypothetical protein
MRLRKHEVYQAGTACPAGMGAPVAAVSPAPPVVNGIRSHFGIGIADARCQPSSGGGRVECFDPEGHPERVAGCGDERRGTAMIETDDLPTGDLSAKAGRLPGHPGGGRLRSRRLGARG